MDILSTEQIDFFKKNQNEITFELLETLRSFGNNGKKLALEILDMEKDEDNYYLDAFGNRISFNGNRQLKKPYTKLKLSKIHLDEIKRCSEDIFYFLKNYVRIVTPKDGINFPEMREYQEELLELISERTNESIIVTLGRQAGKSVTLGIDGAHQFIFEKDYGIGIAANKMSMSREFIDKIKKILINVPIWMMPGITVWNKSTIEGENGVRIMSDTATDGAFRGFTVNKIVVDETAFIKRWQEFADSVFPSQSGLSRKQNILISTPCGMNHFYDIWKDSSIPNIKTGERTKSKNGFLGYTCDWKRIPRYDSKGNKLEPEEFKKSIVDKFGIVYWRQNYECEFMGSSVTLINIETLLEFKEEEPIQIENPGLKIYKEPIKGHQYIIGVDSAKDGEDAFAIQIIDITNLNFEQVASANLYVNYLNMPDFLDEWGRLYNHALMIIENNEGAGQSIADRLVIEYEYDNMYYDKESNGLPKKYPGFRTTPKSRKQILSTIKKIAEESKLKIVDSETIKQLFSFILVNGKFQADNGRHDDLVMALSVCFGIFANSNNFDDMGEVIKQIESKDSDLSFDITNYLSIGNFDLEDEKWEKLY